MNEQYTVVKAFSDKHTNQSYAVGQAYNAADQDRARELESGGYIAHSNSVAAQNVNTHSQAQAQELAKAHNAAAVNAEPKTVVNGKVVSLKAAQAAEAAFANESFNTGVQEHHNNATEAVQAGAVAKNQSAAQQAAQVNVKAANVQSAQSHMETHVQQAQSQSNQAAAGVTAANPMAAEHQEAAATAAEQQAKSKARSTAAKKLEQ